MASEDPHPWAPYFVYDNIKRDEHLITVSVHWDDDERPRDIIFKISRTATFKRARVSLEFTARQVLRDLLKEAAKRLDADEKARQRVQ